MTSLLRVVALCALSTQGLLAQSTGLLLGLATGNPGEYRTLWIAPDDGPPRIVADVPDLIVPGRTGFWRVCLVSGHAVESGELSTWDSLLVRRATPRRGACAASHAQPDQPDVHAHCSSSSDAEIQFAGAAAISVSRHDAYDCGAHPDGAVSFELRTLSGRRIPLDKLLTPAGRDSLVRTALADGRVAFSDFGVLSDTSVAYDVETDTLPSARLSLMHAWGITRAPGRWHLEGLADCSPHVACGELVHDFPIPHFDAPRSLEAWWLCRRRSR